MIHLTSSRRLLPQAPGSFAAVTRGPRTGVASPAISGSVHHLRPTSGHLSLQASRQWLACGGLLLGAFFATFGATMVNLGLPSIQRDLQADLLASSWVVTGYTLVLAALLIAADRWAEQFGRKRAFLLAITLFGLGSSLSGVAPSLGWLILFRLLQGLGVACLSTTSLALCTAALAETRRSLATSFWGAAAGLAATTGPLYGGVLTQVLGWRWLFFATLPGCLLCFLLVAFFLPSKEPPDKKPLDVAGLVTLSCALASLMIALSEGNRWGWTSGPLLLLWAVALVSLLLFVAIERRQQDPFVDVGLFRNAHFTLATVATFLFGGAFQGALFLLPLYLLTLQHVPLLQVSMALSPLAASALLVSLRPVKNSRPQFAWLQGAFGLLLLAVGYGLLCQLSPEHPTADVIWRAAIIGAGIGLCFSRFPVCALADLSPARAQMGSRLFATVRLLGFTCGVAVLTCLFTSSWQQQNMTAHLDSVRVVQTDHRLPSTMRQELLVQLAHTPQPPSRAQMLQIADDEPDMLPELAALSDRLDNDVQHILMQAFTQTWGLAALFPTMGLFLMAGVGLGQHRVARKRQARAWATAYAFSPHGKITPSTIQAHLVASCHALTLYTSLPPHISRMPLREKAFQKG